MGSNKHSDKVPKGKFVPMYLTDDGRLYSLRYKNENQIKDVSNMMGMILSGIMGELYIDKEPIVGNWMIVDKRKT